MEPDWVMQMGRIRDVVSHLVHDFVRSGSRMDTKEREQDLEQLTSAVLEFGKMRCQFYRNEIKMVDVTELALRLRETTRAITSTLNLLEKRGLAERTDVPQRWRLYVRDLDQQPRGGRPIDLRTG
jgi:hypothetical protein